MAATDNCCKFIVVFHLTFWCLSFLVRFKMFLWATVCLYGSKIFRSWSYRSLCRLVSLQHSKFLLYNNFHWLLRSSIDLLIVKQLLALDQLLTLPTGLELSLAQFHWQLSWFGVLLRCLANASFPGRIVNTTLHKVLIWDTLLYGLLASTRTWPNAIIDRLWA